jgi:hypothetical protein
MFNNNINKTLICFTIDIVDITYITCATVTAINTITITIITIITITITIITITIIVIIFDSSIRFLKPQQQQPRLIQQHYSLKQLLTIKHTLFS